MTASDTSKVQEKVVSQTIRTLSNGQPAHHRRGWQRRLSSHRILLVFLVLVILGLALGLGLGLGLKRNASSDSDPIHHRSSNSTGLVVGTTFDYALGYDLTTSIPKASTVFYSADLQNTPSNTIASLIEAGHYIACYFSAGSIESYRPDASEIPSEAIGNVMDGWPDEKWLDVRNAGVRSVMAARIELAESKGCNGIDADNIDGYANDSGFNLTEDDAVNYIQFLATEAKNKGMAYGLKNGGDLIQSVLNVSAWVVNEQCVAFNECSLYQPFIHVAKPVFHIEYTDEEDATGVNDTFREASCGADGQVGFTTIIKHMDLDNWVVDCS